MISLEDCLGLCGLTESEVLAIAEHEHIPEIVAASLGQYLLNKQDGAERICTMIRDDVRGALAHNDPAHARELVEVLRHFLDAYPELRHPS